MRAMEDATFMRKAMKAGPVNWGELAGAISYYQAEFGHTLPAVSYTHLTLPNSTIYLCKENWSYMTPKPARC